MPSTPPPAGFAPACKKGLRRGPFCAMLSTESSDMRTTHIRLSTVLALGFAWCALPVHAQSVHAQWLAPGAGYDAGAAGATTLGAGWSVLNAQTEAEQNTQLDYTVTADTDGQDTYLDFANGALASSETLYLALGISQNANDTTQTPVVMSPLGAGLFRIDTVTAKVRFEQSAAAPKLDDLRALYTDYEFQGQPNAAVAAKAALYLGTDDRFYVARARPDETGSSERVVFDWCRTEVDYASLGGGAVNVRFEFCTFRLTGTEGDVPTRAYRIWVSNPADPTTEVCLTKGLGFPWLSNPDDGYVFDFSTLGTGDWFYAIDSAAIAAGQGAADTSLEAINALDKLNQLAFSASGGGFYSAQIEQSKATSIDSLNLENYDTGDFAAYLSNDAGKTLVQEWALEYGVTLTDYLQPNGARLMAANASGGLDKTAEAFNDFLLYVDPESGVEHRLCVTGIVPAEDGTTVTLSVRAPEGADLRLALSKAGELCVTRAETLDGLSGAKPEPLSGSISFDGDTATVVLDNATPKPFMKVTLRPKTL